MKWDKANKKRLHEVIEVKLHDIADRTIIHRNLPSKLAQYRLDEREIHFAEFFVEFGIKYAPYPTKRKNCVVIVNPWFGLKAVGGPKAGLSIPEDVAEKFLLLGIP